MEPTVADFDAFCRATSPRLVGALVLQFGDRGRAEDAAQEAFARAWARWPTVAAMERPDRWVFTVAYRLAIGGRRRHAAEGRANDRSAAGAEPADATIDELVIDRMVLDAALRAMSPRQRAAITLRYYADCSVHETAEIMRCADGTVKALTSQAIDRLRSTLDAAGTRGAVPTTSEGEPR